MDILLLFSLFKLPCDGHVFPAGDVATSLGTGAGHAACNVFYILSVCMLGNFGFLLLWVLSLIHISEPTRRS